jgi:hypothetical protein
MKGLLSVAWVFLVVALLCSPTYGTGLRELEGRHLLKEAELIFQGVVTNIEYGVSSKRSEEDELLPHTFVTFKIEEIFKGETKGDTITLRFQGGRQTAKGEQGEYFQYMLVNMVPLFDIGDRDILCVRGNGTRICPLVGMNAGRFRVIEDIVYSDLGRPFELSDKLEDSLPFQANDIIDPETLFSRLLNPTSRLDTKMASLLSEETREALLAAQKAQRNSAAVRYAESLLARDLNNLSGIGAYVKEPSEAAFPGILFSRDDLTSIPLRSQTQTLLTRDVTKLSLTETLTLNRLSFEDIYGESIVKSLNRNLVMLPIAIQDVPASVAQRVLTYEALCEGCVLQMTIGPAGDLVGDSFTGAGKSGTKPADSLSPSQEIPTNVLTRAEFAAYLKDAIPLLHTSEELGALAPVATLTPTVAFYVGAITPGLPTLDIAPPRITRDLTEFERLEEEAVAKSGFNPVLTERKPR